MKWSTNNLVINYFNNFNINTRAHRLKALNISNFRVIKDLTIFFGKLVPITFILIQINFQNLKSLNRLYFFLKVKKIHLVLFGRLLFDNLLFNWLRLLLSWSLTHSTEQLICHLSSLLFFGINSYWLMLGNRFLLVVFKAFFIGNIICLILLF